MKTMSYLKVASTLIVLLLIATSCSTSKKMALSCPKPISNYKSKVASSHSRKNMKIFASSQRDNKNRFSFNKNTFRKSKVHHKSVNPLSETSNPKTSTSLTVPENTSISNKMEYEANLFASVDNSQISVGESYPPITNSKDEIADFGNNKTVYERVGTIPISGNSSSEITILKYSLEKLNSFRTTPINVLPQETEKKIEGLSLAGFIAGIVGLIVAGIPLGAVAIILSAVGLFKIKNNPGKYMGKGLAIAGLIVGIVDIVAIIILLAIV